jgi:membrane protein DedA with SNARE-associated domain
MTRFALHFLTPELAYPLLFLLVGIESSGIPLPGETFLVIAGVAAARGRLSIAWVIGVAALAAIVGDNLGYLAGRRVGRRLWLWGRWGRERRERWLEEVQRFMTRHGSSAVVVGRWITVARYTVAWAAGINRMCWWRFALLNALGGISWAITIGLAAYAFGEVAGKGFEALGAIALLSVILAIAGRWAWRRLSGGGEDQPAG